MHVLHRDVNKVKADAKAENVKDNFRLFQSFNFESFLLFSKKLQKRHNDDDGRQVVGN